MEEELEALQSVYDTLNVISGERTELSMHCQPRYSTSFVSAHIHIVLPTDYPTVSLHSFNIVKSIGLIDEGASIVKKVHEFLSSNVDDGEPILFQLFDLVFDCLDASNQGECLICAEELLISQGKQGQGLLTKCSHSFHTRCLSRWAAISMCQSQLRAQGSTAKSRDDRSFSSTTLRFLHTDYSFIQPQHIIFKHSPYSNIPSPRHSLQQHTSSVHSSTPNTVSKQSPVSCVICKGPYVASRKNSKDCRPPLPSGKKKLHNYRPLYQPLPLQPPLSPQALLLLALLLLALESPLSIPHPPPSRL